MIYDLPGASTVVSLYAGHSQANNAGSPVLDLQAYDFVGKIAINVDVGVKTIGDANGAISVQLGASATNNVSNAVAFGSFVNTSNNATINADLSVDPRAVANRYLFALVTITGTNSPAYPLSITARGFKKVQ